MRLSPLHEIKSTTPVQSLLYILVVRRVYLVCHGWVGGTAGRGWDGVKTRMLGMIEAMQTRDRCVGA